MVAALIVVVSLLLTVQFFYSYCHSLIASASRTELSPSVRELAAAVDESSGADKFPRLLQLIEICPAIESDGGELRIVRVYYRLVRLVEAVSRPFLPPLATWAGRERTGCSHFAAVALDRHIASSRKYIARQERGSL